MEIERREPLRLRIEPARICPARVAQLTQSPGMSWEPFLAFEGIRTTKDPQGIQTVAASYFVPTLREAMSWVPEELISSLSPLVLRRQESQQEWGNDKLIAQGKDGAHKVTFIFEGISNPSDAEMGAEYTGDGKVNPEPIGSHPDLRFLIEKYEGEVDPQNQKLTFPTELSGSGSSFGTSGSNPVGTNFSFFNAPYVSPSEGISGSIKNPMYGVTKYWAAALTWKCTYATLKVSPDVTRRVGKIDQPRPAPDGYLPTIPDSHAWLKVIGNPQLKGNVYRVEEGWMAMLVNAVRDVYR